MDVTLPKMLIPETARFEGGPTHVQTLFDITRPDITMVRLSDHEKFLLLPVSDSVLQDPEADIWSLAKNLWINHVWTKEDELT